MKKFWAQISKHFFSRLESQKRQNFSNSFFLYRKRKFELTGGSLEDFYRIRKKSFH